MHERKYEFSPIYIALAIVAGVLSGYLAIFISIIYPIFSLHKHVISETLHFTAIEYFPNDYIHVLTFSLYWALLLLIIFLPIDRFFKYKEAFGKNLFKIINLTIKDLFLKLCKVLYCLLLFSLCYVISIWLSNTALVDLINAINEQNTTIMSSLFILTMAIALMNLTHLVFKTISRKSLS